MTANEIFHKSHNSSYSYLASVDFMFEFLTQAVTT